MISEPTFKFFSSVFRHQRGLKYYTLKWNLTWKTLLIITPQYADIIIDILNFAGAEPTQVYSLGYCK